MRCAYCTLRIADFTGLFCGSGLARKKGASATKGAWVIASPSDLDQAAGDSASPSFHKRIPNRQATLDDLTVLHVFGGKSLAASR